MNEQTITKITSALQGLKQHEWIRVKQQVDMIFSSKAAKVELDDLSELKRNLKVAFNFQRFGGR